MPSFLKKFLPSNQEKPTDPGSYEEQSSEAAFGGPELNQLRAERKRIQQILDNNDLGFDLKSLRRQLDNLQREIDELERLT